MDLRWSCRYSSSEMMYIDLAPDGSGVHVYLDHSPSRGDRFSAADVLEGALDGEVRAVFGDNVVREVIAAMQVRRSASPSRGPVP